VDCAAGSIGTISPTTQGKANILARSQVQIAPQELLFLRRNLDQFVRINRNSPDCRTL
jgi:hypothetical protein